MPEMELRLRIAETELHHHASRVLDSRLVSLVEDAITQPLTVAGSVRTETRAGVPVERPGITAASLNIALKRAFAGQRVWSFEARVSDGVIFDHLAPQGGRIEGFDLAMYDSRANLAALWTLCFGRRGLHGGQEEWRTFLSARPDLKSAAADVAESAVPGTDLHVDVSSPTVLGEIQFANWALVHRDLLKLVSAQKQIAIDLFVYVVATGELSRLLSAQTVNFSNSRATVREFASLVTVPTWIVGLDLTV